MAKVVTMDRGGSGRGDWVEEGMEWERRGSEDGVGEGKEWGGSGWVSRSGRGR